MRGAVSTRTLTVGAGNGSGTFSGVLENDTFDAGTLALTKSGTGTQILTGVNTYTGITTVTGGALEVSVLANGGVASSIGMSASAATNLVLNGGVLRYAAVPAFPSIVFLRSGPQEEGSNPQVREHSPFLPWMRSPCQGRTRPAPLRLAGPIRETTSLQESSGTTGQGQRP
ncbi:autotransporter-associated beta strand repeat-containing protein [Verrucomicrobium spinosum]|uniref:autotransporter-associated beta strand repeat-containing protein n=1 Tax=Verrucomicrobium spinosum TaxID=2736 RepID=UPI000A887F45|nr:autotransporter-associated beta strand repeat-containing protein [Verrucomicrobium spinosum]